MKDVPFPLYIVEWEDPIDRNQETPGPGARRLGVWLSVGWLVDKDDKVIVISRAVDGIDPAEGSRDTTTIHRALVKRMKRINK